LQVSFEASTGRKQNTIASGKRVSELAGVLRKALRYLELGSLERILQPLFHDCAFILDPPWRMVPERFDIDDGSVKDRDDGREGIRERDIGHGGMQGNVYHKRPRS